jgi:excisionase family DNA binding protein
MEGDTDHSRRFDWARQGLALLVIKNKEKEPIMKELLSKEPMTEEQDPLLTVHEIARYLRVDDTTVRRWIKAGALEAIVLPHRGRRQTYRIRKSALDQLLA